MKQKALLTLASLMLAASASADPVSLGKARSEALRLMPASAEATLVKAAGTTAAQLRRAPLADSAQKPYYIFSRGAGQGYVIASGDDCLPAILGYTESGDFDEATCAPALLDWLDGYQQLIEQAQASGLNAPRKAAARAASNSSWADIPTLVKTHWHQSSPYNDQCPLITSSGNRSITGCVATAASQVVFYHKAELPDSIKYDTPTYSYGDAPVTTSFKAGTPLKWDLMQLSYSGSEPSDYRSAVATFVASLGAQTWLTYGSSTSGQISKLVYTFSHQYNLTGTCIYKSGYSQSDWEKLIYSDLADGKPIVYSGVHPSNGGHAVVLDGYQASTGLFHFNFGWGGQGDGWYTVDDQTGMNGFYGQQGMVYKIAPSQPTVEVSLDLPASLATQRTNTVNVLVSNKSTVPYSGLMLFANTTGVKPTSTTTAKSSDKTTSVPAGQTVSVPLTLRPGVAGKWYLFVTNADRRLLAIDSVEAEARTASVTLDAIAMEASSASEQGADAAYPVIYNAKKATGTMSVTNSSRTDFSSNLTLLVDESTDGGATFANVGKKTQRVNVAAGEKAEVEFSLTSSAQSLKAGNLYRVYVQTPVSLSSGDAFTVATADSAARFSLREANLTATLEADSTLTFAGEWDVNTFNTLVGARANSAATLYDLTEVNAVGHVPAIDGKPNALFYVADGSAATGRNVVTASGKSGHIDLMAGMDFRARTDMEADSVTLHVAFVPGAWQLFTTPATLTLPQGFVARSIDSHKRTGIAGCTSYVSQLEAGHTYLVSTLSAADTLLTAGHAAVAAKPAVNTDTLLIGTFKATTLPVKAFLPSTSTGYFETANAGEAVEAMGGYIIKDSRFLTTRFMAYEDRGLDTTYVNLAKAIAQCRQALTDYAQLTTAEANAALAEATVAAEEVLNGRTYTSRTSLSAYVTKLLEQLAAYKRSLKPGLTGLHEDFTSAIVNPSFEAGSLDGWKKGSSSSPKAQKTATLTYYASGCEGSYLLYCATSSETGTNVYQTVENLLPGTYTLTAMLGTKDDNTVTLYADSLEATTGAHPMGQYYLNEVTIENIEVGQEGTLQIGVKPCKWYKADAFKLYCTATAADPTGIKSVGADTAAKPSIRVENRRVVITTTKPTALSIHNLQGIAVWHEVVDGMAQVELPKGLYVVGGKKIAVK